MAERRPDSREAPLVSVRAAFHDGPTADARHAGGLPRGDPGAGGGLRGLPDDVPLVTSVLTSPDLACPTFADTWLSFAALLRCYVLCCFVLREGRKAAQR